MTNDKVYCSSYAAISIAIIGAHTPATASANGVELAEGFSWMVVQKLQWKLPKEYWATNRWQWYYFDGRGYITHSNGERIKDYWYYFNTSGHMTENAWEITGYAVLLRQTKSYATNQWVGDSIRR